MKAFFEIITAVGCLLSVFLKSDNIIDNDNETTYERADSYVANRDNFFIGNDRYVITSEFKNGCYHVTQVVPFFDETTNQVKYKLVETKRGN